jgi:hypothetical membrane protein
VAAHWPRPYSISRNTISDLGNTACGAYGGRLVCSPLHGVMNASFITLGITMSVGSVLILREFGRSRGAAAGLAAMAISGLGVMMIGAFPENSVPAAHGTGAGVTFVVGNAGIIIAGRFLIRPAPLRLYSYLSGFIALIALGCFVSGQYLGLGEGGMERVVAYPQTAWLIVIGLYLLAAGRDPARRVPAARRAAGPRGRPGVSSRPGRGSRWSRWPPSG